MKRLIELNGRRFTILLGALNTAISVGRALVEPTAKQRKSLSELEWMKQQLIEHWEVFETVETEELEDIEL